MDIRTLIGMFLPLATLLLLVGCSGGSSSASVNAPRVQSDFDLELSGSWRSTCFERGFGYAYEDWRISNGEFAKFTYPAFPSYGDCKPFEGDAPVEEYGLYSVGAEVVLANGLTANRINFTFIEPDGSTRVVLDVAYLQDGILYLGKENLLQTCEGEYYTIEFYDITITDGAPTNFEEMVKECLGVPTELNFEKIYSRY